MDAPARFSRQKYIAHMLHRAQEIFGQVADAVNHAPDGQWIAASEEKARDLLAQLRQEAFQTAVQMRTEAAQAAFSPSPGPGQRPQAPPQGTAGHPGADRQ